MGSVVASPLLGEAVEPLGDSALTGGCFFPHLSASCVSHGLVLSSEWCLQSVPTLQSVPLEGGMVILPALLCLKCQAEVKCPVVVSYKFPSLTEQIQCGSINGPAVGHVRCSQGLVALHSHSYPLRLYE